MGNVKKSLRLVAIALISIAAASCRKNEAQKAVAPTLIGKPKLVVETKYAERIYSVAFSPNGKMLASGSGSNTVKLWDLNSNTKLHTLNEQRWSHEVVDKIIHVAFSPDGKILASGSHENSNIGSNDDDTIKLWDVASGIEIGRLECFDNVISLAFNPDGKTLASKSSDGIIKLWDITTSTMIRSFRGPSKVICPVVFSPDGKKLASSFDTTIKLWDVATGADIRTLKGHGDEVSSIAFSPDSKMLISCGRDDTIRLWDVATGTKLRASTKHTGVLSVAFSPDNQTLASAGLDHTVRLWEVATGRELHTLEGHTDEIFPLSFSPDGKTLASASLDHMIKLWDVAKGEELVSLVSFIDDRWVVAKPDGRFDTNSIDDIEDLHWQMPDVPMALLPLEVFMRDYYDPRLLQRVLAREKFKPVRDFSTLNLTQPEVKIVGITPDSAETFQVIVEVSDVKSTVQLDTGGKPLKSGVYDVRLFRDEQLVGYAPKGDGAVELNAGGKAKLKFSHIKWPRTGLRNQSIDFSAYAFNADGVKSATARAFTEMEMDHELVKGRAYVISLGVNAYQREGLNLRYAANDARQVQDNLGARLATQGEYEEVISIPLVSDYAVELNGRAVAAQDITLEKDEKLKDFLARNNPVVTENRATKAHLQAVLDVLAGRQANADLLKEIPNADKLRAARPEDLVLLSVSSHGYTDSDGIFYIVPSDTGTAEIKSPDGRVSPEFRAHCVSSDELSRWLRDVDAGELVLIVDACHSAAAVEGTDFKPGPMGSRGLGQLSYDKGMRILTATQADNVALEAANVRQGLLIYALLQDGLGAWQADYKPRDNSIMLTEWLGYGVERVPRLSEEVKAGRIRSTVDPQELDNDKIQQPSLFDFARRQREVVLARHR